MKAVAVAGGEGTRIRPLTLHRPKPMVPLVNRTVLDHMVHQLQRYGVTELQLTLRYMASLIQNFFQSRPSDDIHIRHAIEDFPLGTAGSLKAAVSDWDEPFLVVSGDGLTDTDFRLLYNTHMASGADVTIALYRVNDPRDFGVVLQDQDQWVYDFVEKPRPSEERSNKVNTGIYVINPSVLDLIPEAREYDFSHDLFPAMLRQKGRIYGHVLEGYWCDIGNTDQYMQATQDILRGQVALLDPLGQEIAPGIWAERNVSIHPTAVLEGPIYLGHDVQVNAHANIQGPAVIRHNAIVDSHARIEQSVIWRNSYIGPSSHIRHSIVCRQCSIRSNTHVSEGCVIGDGCVLDEGVILLPHVKLWPYKHVRSSTTVRESIIWGRQARQELFRGSAITGQTNLDLTSELAAKIGVALGSTLPKGAYVAVNRDTHRASRMIKRAIISGLPGAGIHVCDLGSVALPVLRHFVRRNPEMQAGVHVRVNPDDPHPQSLIVQILEEDGSNLGKAMERRVQSIFFREEFRRVGMDDLGSISYAQNFMEAYVQDFLSKVFEEQLHMVPFKLVVDYSNGPVADVMSSILERMQIDTIPLNSLIQENTLFQQADRMARKQAELAAIVTAVQAHLGIMFDVTGEIIHLVDDQGTVLNTMQAAALFLELALFNHPASRVVFPGHMPEVFHTQAARYDAMVVHSKSDMHNLMTMAGSGNVLVALDGLGHFIFPFFHPAPDPMMAILKLLEYLALRGEPISRIMATLPAIHHKRLQVAVPWVQKSRIMERLNGLFQADRLHTLEGLKVRTGTREWVQFQPNALNPAIDLTVDAAGDDRAETLVLEFGQAISRLVEPEA